MEEREILVDMLVVSISYFMSWKKSCGDLAIANFFLCYLTALLKTLIEKTVNIAIRATQTCLISLKTAGKSSIAILFYCSATACVPQMIAKQPPLASADERRFLYDIIDEYKSV